MLTEARTFVSTFTLPSRIWFDKGVKKIEALAPPGVEKDAITSELNYITDRKTKKGWGSIDERDAETTLGLRPIDRGNDDQSLSLAKDIADPRRPSYVVINVNTGETETTLMGHEDLVCGNCMYTSNPGMQISLNRHKCAETRINMRR